MTRPYFVTPYSPRDWQTAKSDLVIDPSRYRDLLTKDWPDIEFYSPKPTAILAWGLAVPDGGRVYGGLQPNAQVVWLDMPVEDFFLWHRKVIPDRHRLFLFPANSYETLELNPATTLEEIRVFVARH